MLNRATQIASTYPTFICAQYALATIDLNGPWPSEHCQAALEAAWNTGLISLAKEMPSDLLYSASQGNASFLNAGSRLAIQYVLQSDLAAAAGIADRASQLDAEVASDAHMIRAHIQQLRGDKNALSSLIQIATAQTPTAFYALGLEYLRRNKATDAVLAFQQGIRGAPEVAEILLGKTIPQVEKGRHQPLAAKNYVETFCLSEWTGADLSALSKVVKKTVASKW